MLVNYSDGTEVGHHNKLELTISSVCDHFQSLLMPSSLKRILKGAACTAVLECTRVHTFTAHLSRT